MQFDGLNEKEISEIKKHEGTVDDEGNWSSSYEYRKIDKPKNLVIGLCNGDHNLTTDHEDESTKHLICTRCGVGFTVRKS